MMVLVSFLEILATMERNTLATISSEKIVHVQVMVVMTQMLVTTTLTQFYPEL